MRSQKEMCSRRPSCAAPAGPGQVPDSHRHPSEVRQHSRSFVTTREIHVAAALRITTSTKPTRADMRRLNEEAIRDVARGAAVLGTGGGGDPYLGTLAALRALEQFGSPQVVEVTELPDESLVASPVMVGASE